jgi:hypothetical protein
MPTLDDKDIDDRSKANWFTKGIALTQACWFLLQLLARVHDRLPISTLELYTLGIVLCGVVTYGGYWNKPFDVQRPVVLQATERLDSRKSWFVDRLSLVDSKVFPSSLDSLSFWLMSISMCATFAGSHLLGWNFHFSTSVELWLWRVGSICCFVLPIALAIGAFVESNPKSSNSYTFLIMALYALMRLALFVEMFFSLRSVPAGVYQTPKWSNYIPSFG